MLKISTNRQRTKADDEIVVCVTYYKQLTGFNAGCMCVRWANVI